MKAGNSGGNSMWKKCEVLCASPIRPMVVKSLRALGAGRLSAAALFMPAL